MRDVIDFLLRNLGMVIVVAGFILTLLAKRNGRENRRPGTGRAGGGKPNPMMPPFGGGPQGIPHRRPQPSPPSDRSGPDQSRPAPEQTRDEPARRIDGEGSHRYLEQDGPSGRTESPAADNRSDAGTAVIEADRAGRDERRLAEDAIRGMLWAEIMGPPRSKKPYRPKNR
ncbi:hypothetical protein [Paenibacillus sp. GYB003]|uniref:hypothetical protein n=1 Tax=Paenibacillus sp. GYB003 TaxID=2994392 RepID=UPI002F96D288